MIKRKPNNSNASSWGNGLVQQKEVF